MKSLFSYLLVLFAAMFWIFRVVVTLMYSLQQDFICKPFNSEIEIAILFLSIPCIVFIIRRNLVSATVFMGINAAYFGTALFGDAANVNKMAENVATLDLFELGINVIGIVIPVLIFLDVAIQKSRFKPKDTKTDWYYDNKKFDREYDERADRNQYKIK